MIWVVGERTNPTGRQSITDSQARLAALMAVDRDLMMRSVLWLNLFEYPGTDPQVYVRVIEESAKDNDAVLLLGRPVHRAFGLGAAEPMTVLTRNLGQGPTIVVVPHPSGLNRWWNDPDHSENASIILRAMWGGHSR